MATTRQRRANAAPPAQELYSEEDRVYTEEDYALPPQAEDLPDEWNADQNVYAAPGWTGENVLPDEAFLPDEDDMSAEEAWAEDAPLDEYGEEFAPMFEEAFDFTDDLDPLSEDLLTEEEQAELRRSHWQLLAGLADFAGVIIGTAAILVLVTLLVSLVNWLINDLSQSFILLQKNL